ncbi:Ca-transporting ATPase [Boletus edulis BED1]|uniref:Calcium-transporting ATPase n=1 Tax=Boletus edulis BED1 TaxID=1328754 RepID=A0AAD4BUB8_BOLED|nr:Ca-transporting ATPase [Boletus edulis BED1]
MPPAPRNIPAIVTTDLSSKLSLVNDQPPSTPPPPDLLSPHPPVPFSSAHRSSLDIPRSPSPSLTFVSSNDASSFAHPPSPTLSTQSSVHFATSIALRDNKPDERSGISSLQLLSPSAIDRTANRRKGSITTFASSHDGHSSIDETEVDHSLGAFDLSPIRRPKSDATSLTVASHTHFASDPAKLQTHSPDDNLPFPSTQIQHDTLPPAQTSDPPAQQDSPSDLGPFSLDPDQLASLLDPKDLDALQALGGTTGILNGLGTHPTRGLLVDHASHPSHLSPGTREGVSEGNDSHGHKSLSTPPDDPLLQSSSTSHLDDMCKAPDPHTASLADRKAVYGENVLPHRPTTSLLGLMWHALKDKVLVLLSIAAVVSLALGLFQDFGTTLPAGQPPVDWVEGVAIIIAILIVVVVGSLNDWKKERQFEVLNQKKDERTVKVIRNGEERLIDIKEVLVGDIALLEPGEVVPCDGIFLSGHNVKCDESAATGEADAIKKAPYLACLALKNAQNNLPHGDDGAIGGHPKHSLPSPHHMDCFIVSGSKVLEGVGQYVVIAVGVKSFNGRIMAALRTDIENTPLQVKLNVLAELIAKVGSVAGLVLFSALMIRFFVQLGTNNPSRTANEKGMAFVQILIISVTLVVVAVPEGLPLAVTLALSFATRRMTEENLLVRVLGSCETMANASVICTDKTGTLTQNAMTVVAGSIGIHAKFVRQLQHNQSRTNVVDEHRSRRSTDSGISRHIQDFSVDQSRIDTVLSPQLRKLFNAAVAINTTAFEDVDPTTHQKIFIGSKTEGALLNFVKELNWPSYKQVRDAAEVIQVLPFSSDRKAMGVVVKLKDGSHRLYIKGASEILAKLCVRHVVASQDANQASDEDATVETIAIDTYAEANVSRTIIFYANQSLRTIAICYRDFASWPPPGVHLNGDEDVRYEDLARELTLIGIVGIEDPLREGVRQAVADCQKAGVTVKMCTGDNVLTARSIASQCGIFTAGGIVMEGPIFRKLNDAEMLDVLPRLQVLARSSPEDKRILVEKLRSLGEIVAVTGDGTNDGPALKTAHIGFSMGIAGTEVAKDASDVVLMDDNFSSIVKAIMWGRCVNDAVRKFLQFQLSTNVTAVVVTSLTAIISSSETSALSAVQLLWINIIMDTFAALALATDPATPVLLDRKPDKLTSPLFTVDMYKQIFLQSAYQIAITLIFHFFGLQILGLENTSTNATVVQTIVFNIFVFAQIFNSLNSRRLDRKLNVFEGLLKNHYFVVVTLIEIVVQVIIVFIGGAAFQVTRIDGREWGISLALGVVSIPLGAFIRLLPNKPFERLFVLVRLLPSPEVLPTIKPDAEWNEAIELVRDNLATFVNLRGGRLRSSSFVWKSRSGRVLDDRRVPLPSIMTMVPTLIASSIGAGWAPHSHGTLSDPARYDPSRSSAALWEGRLQVHPDTKPDDPIFQKWGGQGRLRSSSPPF